VFFCDDNFIGNKKHARDLLQELSLWSRRHGSPFGFQTQASLNLGQDLAMIDLMTDANLGNVFIGIESPEEKVLNISHKYTNIQNPLAESVNNIKHNGMTVMGSFILGLDGESKGAGQRICEFMDQTSIPIAMLGLLQAPPQTKLWKRLEKEGRLRGDAHRDWGGTFAGLNYYPDRPEAEILQEYMDAWDYLYEPSHYLERAYRFYLAMRPTRQALAITKGEALPREDTPNIRMPWRKRLYEVLGFFTIVWWQGIRASCRVQFWTQLLGMWRQNPSRIKSYLVACAMGQDLMMMREIVRDKVTAIMQERGMEARGKNLSPARTLMAQPKKT
jgi:radical SAM superfamily enzyme YgiQ (UPF0313 family)